MKTFLLFAFALTLPFHQIFAQCNEVDEIKVLLIGDSWAFFMGVDGTINNVFEQWGHSNKTFTTTIEVAVNGARTSDFLETNMQTEIRDLINSNPSIEVVHLSIGGNDVLGEWNVNYTTTELDSLIDLVYEQTLAIITFLKSTKPGLKIVFSGYVYPNFEEVIESAAPLQSSHPFYGTWEDMGFPGFFEINTLLNQFSILLEDYAETDPQVEFFKATALMQYTFGQTSPLGVTPGGTYPPFTQPQPFGDPTYPSPKNSMRDYFGITKDCFHLSPKGYRDLIGFHTQKFYHKFLMGDQYLLTTPSNNGTVSALQNTYSDLLLGFSGGEEFATLLNFQTQDMNWEGLDKAEIFLNIQNISGTNPLNQAIEISINAGNIGTSAAPEGSDWNATVDMVATPCVFGKKDGPGDWIRIALPTSFLPFLKSQSNTQFLIKGSGNTDGVVTFSDSQDEEFAPVLNFKYDNNYVGVNQINNAFGVTLYPNPGNSLVHISSQELVIESIEIYDLLGKMCFVNPHNSSKLYNLSSLSDGFYKIVIKSGDQQVTKSFVKN